MRRLTLTLPLPPNMANSRMHWRTKDRARKAYNGHAAVQIQNQRVAQGLKWRTLQQVRVTATLYVWSLMDDDNAVARLKWPLDSLKAAGLIVDDKRPHLELTGIPRQVVDRKAQRVVLALEAV